MEETPRRPVAKTVGAVDFVDDYDWLQRDTDEALAWMWRRDAEAQAAIQAIPGYAALKQAVALAMGYGTGADASGTSNGASYLSPRWIGGLWFRHVSTTEGSTAPSLHVSEQATGPGRLVVAGPALATEQDDAASVSFTWYEPSPNAELVAIGFTSRGEMTGKWRVVEVATGRLLDVIEPCIAYSGAMVGWLPDASGFYLADRVEDGRHRVRFVPVKPGTPTRQPHVFGLDEIPANVAGVTIQVSPDGRSAITLSGPHERIATMVGDLVRNEWRAFMPPGHEGECQGAWLDGATYVARIHDGDTPTGGVYAVPVATSQQRSTLRQVVAPGRGALKAVGVVDGHVVLAEVLDCAARFRTVSLDGTGERVVPLQGPGTSLVAMLWRRFDNNQAFTFDFGTFTRNTTHYRFDPRSGQLEELGTPGTQVEGVTVTQRFARSIDGTAVPYFLVHRDDLDLTQPQPALVYGYGGFNVAVMPSPLAHLEPFIRAGGILVHANLRGGGEYGKHWHDSGRLAAKWNVFADMFAVADAVIKDGLTRPDRMAMMGGSNGGLLAGAAIVHRPDLWRVVVATVPIFDQMEPLPLDAEFDAARAIFLEDYGSPADPLMSKVLYSYSPYHNVRQGTAYPAVYQVFGEKDLSCRPFNGRKFTAALRAATTSGQPVHCRVWRDVGHGASDAQTRLAQTAEWVAFIMHHLGMAMPVPMPTPAQTTAAPES
jgi:prolyl oligopeptidase